MLRFQIKMPCRYSSIREWVLSTWQNTPLDDKRDGKETETLLLADPRAVWLVVSLDRSWSHHYSLRGSRPCKIHKIRKKSCSWFTGKPNVDGKEHLQAVSVELLIKNGQHWYKIIYQARKHPTKRGLFFKKQTNISHLSCSLPYL